MDNFIMGVLWLGLFAFCGWGMFFAAADTGDIIVCITLGIISACKSANYFYDIKRR